MIPLGRAIEATFKQLGLGEPTVMLQLSQQWDTLAGGPWAGSTRPLFLRQGVLVVEVLTPQAMGFLRYGLTELERKLASRFGSETVRRVELRAAPRRAGPSR